MFDRVLSGYPFSIVYSPDEYITPKMCKEAADDPLATLKLIPAWFFTNKVIKKFCTALYEYTIV